MWSSSCRVWVPDRSIRAIWMDRGIFLLPKAECELYAAVPSQSLRTRL